MNQKSTKITLEKPEKSILWIVATIWANIIGVLLINLVVISLIGLSDLLYSPVSPVVSVIVPNLVLLFFLLSQIFAVRLGIKSVLAKSVIKKEKTLKISIGTGSVLFLALSIFFFLFVVPMYGDHSPPEISLITLILFMLGYFFAISLIYSGITYFWCTKLANELTINKSKGFSFSILGGLIIVVGILAIFSLIRMF